MSSARTILVDELGPNAIDPDYLSRILWHLHTGIIVRREGSDALRLEFTGSDAELDALLEQTKQKLARSRPHPAKVLWTRTARSAAASSNVWNELIDSGQVRDYGDGRVGYGGAFLELVERLDAVFRGAARALRAAPWHFPCTLDSGLLGRLGLLDQHPHQVYFTAPLRADIATIERFQARSREGVAATTDDLEVPRLCLCPSACWPLYPTLAGRDFAEPQHYTFLGACSRHEARNTRSFERLSEFQMREIVVVGDEPSVERFELFCLQILQSAAECFDLSLDVATAQDLFFISNYAEYSVMQSLAGSKLEARVRASAESSEMAIASFNKHHDFFARRCSFSYRGKVAASACVGFGLERFAYAIMLRHGSQPSCAREGLVRFEALYHAPSDGQP